MSVTLYLTKVVVFYWGGQGWVGDVRSPLRTRVKNNSL